MCNLCGTCIDACPNNALKFVGKAYSIADLMQIILQDKIFYDNSGGGVTLSGGEPLYHLTYVHDLLKELRKENIHNCIETSGFYNRKEFEKLILPHVDLIYFDLKIFHPVKHKKYCNISNKQIKKNFESLVKDNKIQVLPRIPLIPSITDTRTNLITLVRYLRSLNITEIGFLPYNPLWLNKQKKIGLTSSYTYSKWLSKEKKDEIKEIFSNFNFKDF